MQTPDQMRSEDYTEDCPICMSSLSEPIAVTACKHSYHSECLHKWIFVNNTCPLCQNEIEIECKNLGDVFDSCYITIKKLIIHFQKREWLHACIKLGKIISLCFKIMKVGMLSTDSERYLTIKRGILCMLSINLYILLTNTISFNFQTLRCACHLFWSITQLRMPCNTYVVWVQTYLIHLFYFWYIVLFSRFLENSIPEIVMGYMHVSLTVVFTCMLFTSETTILILKKVIQYL